MKQETITGYCKHCKCLFHRELNFYEKAGAMIIRNDVCSSIECKLKEDLIQINKIKT